MGSLSAASRQLGRIAAEATRLDAIAQLACSRASGPAGAPALSRRFGSWTCAEQGATASGAFFRSEYRQCTHAAWVSGGWVCPTGTRALPRPGAAQLRTCTSWTAQAPSKRRVCGALPAALDAAAQCPQHGRHLHSVAATSRHPAAVSDTWGVAAAARSSPASLPTRAASTAAEAGAELTATAAASAAATASLPAVATAGGDVSRQGQRRARAHARSSPWAAQSAALRVRGHTVVRAKALSVSVKKMNVVAKLVRRLHVKDAIIQLMFINVKKAARLLLQVVLNARSAATTQLHPLNPEHLVVDEVAVLRGPYTRRPPIFRGRGGIGFPRRPSCHLYVRLREVPDATMATVILRPWWERRNRGRRGVGQRRALQAWASEPEGSEWATHGGVGEADDLTLDHSAERAGPVTDSGQLEREEGARGTGAPREADGMRTV